MPRKRPQHRTDPLLLLVTVVVVGLMITVGFQLSVHSGDRVPTMVKEAPAPIIADG